MKFVVNAAQPFIVPVTNSTWASTRADSTGQPLRTITTAKGGEFALATPYIVPLTHHGQPDRVYAPDKPLPTVTSAHRGEMAFVRPMLAPFVVGAGGAEYGGKPRAGNVPMNAITVHDRKAVVAAFIAKHTSGGIGRDPRQPINTVTANGFEKRAGGATPLGIVCAHIEQANGGPNNDNLAGRAAGAPLSTTTASGSQQRLIASHLVKLRGTCRDGQPIDTPAPTVTASGTHVGQVLAMLIKYYGNEIDGHGLDKPIGTVTTKDRFGLVTVMIAGEEYVIVDIGMRMLTARELARAQGFPDSYILDPFADRRMKNGTIKRSRLPISSQIRMIGNSVNPDVAAALVAANCNVPEEAEDRRAA